MIKNVNDSFDFVIAMLEILEIKTTNSIFQEFQQKVYNELKDFLSKINNVDWLISLLLEARKRK